jgi:hypothetical protein
MRIGGGGDERWLFILPAAGLLVVTLFLFGGPQRAFSVLEHTVYSAWSQASVFFRR